MKTNYLSQNRFALARQLGTDTLYSKSDGRWFFFDFGLLLVERNRILLYPVLTMKFRAMKFSSFPVKTRFLKMGSLQIE